jgi:hypothetical protein
MDFYNRKSTNFSVFMQTILEDNSIFISYSNNVIIWQIE